MRPRHRRPHGYRTPPATNQAGNGRPRLRLPPFALTAPYRRRNAAASRRINSCTAPDDDGVSPRTVEPTTATRSPRDRAGERGRPPARSMVLRAPPATARPNTESPAAGPYVALRLFRCALGRRTEFQPASDARLLPQPQATHSHQGEDGELNDWTEPNGLLDRRVHKEPKEAGANQVEEAQAIAQTFRRHDRPFLSDPPADNLAAHRGINELAGSLASAGSGPWQPPAVRHRRFVPCRNRRATVRHPATALSC